MKQPMKGPLLAPALVILAGGLVLVWRNECRIEQLRAERQDLLAEAMEPGVPVLVRPDNGPSEASGSDLRRSSRGSPDFSVVDFFGGLARQFPSGAEISKRELMDHFFAIFVDLEISHLKQVVAEAESRGALDTEVRRILMDECLRILAERSPEDALALLGTPEDAGGEAVQRLAIHAWSRQNAPATLAWLREHLPGLGKPSAHSLKHTFLAGAAESDPAFALEAVGQLDFQDEASAARSIGRQASAENKDRLLAAVRGLPSGTETAGPASGIRKEVLTGLAESMAGDPFGTTVAWIEASRLNRAETDAFAAGIDGDSAADPGMWLGWLAENTRGDIRIERIGNFVSAWTSRDYKAAAAWIDQAPEDAVKPVAVRAFAEAAGPHDPVGAEEWALTLPPGEIQRATLETIHSTWPPEDVRGRAAFAARHGLRRIDGY